MAKGMVCCGTRVCCVPIKWVRLLAGACIVIILYVYSTKFSDCTHSGSQNQPAVDPQFLKTNIQSWSRTCTRMSGFSTLVKSQKPSSHRCSNKQKNIVFVKVHKAGSSTAVAVIQRFGYRHNLTFALPNAGKDVYLDYPFILKPKMSVLPQQNGSMEFNILYNHAVFNQTTMHKLIPHKSVNLGIVREPLSHFKSVMNYFKEILTPDGETFTSFEKRIQKFVENPHYYDESKNKIRNLSNPNLHIQSVTRNYQSADFGLRYQDMESADVINKFILRIKNEFPFLLVLEYFNESLLLLKRRWCWDLEDILYIKKNVFRYDAKFKAIPEGPADFLRKYWIDIDVKLYNWANTTLWKLIAEEKDFFLELSHYKSVNNLVETFCNSKRSAVKMLRRSEKEVKLAAFRGLPLNIAVSVYNKPITMQAEDCNELLMPERSFTRLLKIRQRPDLYNETFLLKFDRI